MKGLWIKDDDTWYQIVHCSCGCGTTTVLFITPNTRFPGFYALVGHNARGPQLILPKIGPTFEEAEEDAAEWYATRTLFPNIMKVASRGVYGNPLVVRDRSGEQYGQSTV